LPSHLSKMFEVKRKGPASKQLLAELQQIKSTKAINVVSSDLFFGSDGVLKPLSVVAATSKDEEQMKILVQNCVDN